MADSKGKSYFTEFKYNKKYKIYSKRVIFSAARQDIVGKVFIEVFGGSALMAAEALSNYAAKAYAVELDRDSYKFTKKISIT